VNASAHSFNPCAALLWFKTVLQFADQCYHTPIPTSGELVLADVMFFGLSRLLSNFALDVRYSASPSSSVTSRCLWFAASNF
jgi:hypothetical protein